MTLSALNLILNRHLVQATSSQAPTDVNTTPSVPNLYDQTCDKLARLKITNQDGIATHEIATMDLDPFSDLQLQRVTKYQFIPFNVCNYGIDFGFMLTADELKSILFDICKELGFPLENFETYGSITKKGVDIDYLANFLQRALKITGHSDEELPNILTPQMIAYINHDLNRPPTDIDYNWRFAKQIPKEKIELIFYSITEQLVHRLSSKMSKMSRETKQAVLFQLHAVYPQKNWSRLTEERDDFEKIAFEHLGFTKLSRIVKDDCQMVMIGISNGAGHTVEFSLVHHVAFDEIYPTLRLRENNPNLFGPNRVQFFINLLTHRLSPNPKMQSEHPLKIMICQATRGFVCPNVRMEGQQIANTRKTAQNPLHHTVEKLIRLGHDPQNNFPHFVAEIMSHAFLSHLSHPLATIAGTVNLLRVYAKELTPADLSVIVDHLKSAWEYSLADLQLTHPLHAVGVLLSESQENIPQVLAVITLAFSALQSSLYRPPGKFNVTAREHPERKVLEVRFPVEGTSYSLSLDVSRPLELMTLARQYFAEKHEEEAVLAMRYLLNYLSQGPFTIASHGKEYCEALYGCIRSRCMEEAFFGALLSFAEKMNASQAYGLLASFPKLLRHFPEAKEAFISHLQTHQEIPLLPAYAAEIDRIEVIFNWFLSKPQTHPHAHELFEREINPHPGILWQKKCAYKKRLDALRPPPPPQPRSITPEGPPKPSQTSPQEVRKVAPSSSPEMPEKAKVTIQPFISKKEWGNARRVLQTCSSDQFRIFAEAYLAEAPLGAIYQLLVDKELIDLLRKTPDLYTAFVKKAITAKSLPAKAFQVLVPFISTPSIPVLDIIGILKLFLDRSPIVSAPLVEAFAYRLLELQTALIEQEKLTDLLRLQMMASKLLQRNDRKMASQKLVKILSVQEAFTEDDFVLLDTLLGHLAEDTAPLDEMRALFVKMIGQSSCTEKVIRYLQLYAAHYLLNTVDDFRLIMLSLTRLDALLSPADKRVIFTFFHGQIAEYEESWFATYVKLIEECRQEWQTGCQLLCQNPFDNLSPMHSDNLRNLVQEFVENLLSSSTANLHAALQVLRIYHPRHLPLLASLFQRVQQGSDPTLYDDFWNHFQRYFSSPRVSKLKQEDKRCAIALWQQLILSVQRRSSASHAALLQNYQAIYAIVKNHFSPEAQVQAHAALWNCFIQNTQADVSRFALEWVPFLAGTLTEDQLLELHLQHLNFILAKRDTTTLRLFTPVFHQYVAGVDGFTPSPAAIAQIRKTSPLLQEKELTTDFLLLCNRLELPFNVRTKMLPALRKAGASSFFGPGSTIILHLICHFVNSKILPTGDLLEMRSAQAGEFLLEATEGLTEVDELLPLSRIILCVEIGYLASRDIIDTLAFKMLNAILLELRAYKFPHLSQYVAIYTLHRRCTRLAESPLRLEMERAFVNRFTIFLYSSDKIEPLYLYLDRLRELRSEDDKTTLLFKLLLCLIATFNEMSDHLQESNHSRILQLIKKINACLLAAYQYKYKLTPSEQYALSNWVYTLLATNVPVYTEEIAAFCHQFRDRKTETLWRETSVFYDLFTCVLTRTLTPRHVKEFLAERTALEIANTQFSSNGTASYRPVYIYFLNQFGQECCSTHPELAGLMIRALINPSLYGNDHAASFALACTALRLSFEWIRKASIEPIEKNKIVSSFLETEQLSNPEIRLTLDQKFEFLEISFGLFFELVENESKKNYNQALGCFVNTFNNFYTYLVEQDTGTDSLTKSLPLFYQLFTNLLPQIKKCKGSKRSNVVNFYIHAIQVLFNRRTTVPENPDFDNILIDQVNTLYDGLILGMDESDLRFFTPFYKNDISLFPKGEYYQKLARKLR